MRDYSLITEKLRKLSRRPHVRFEAMGAWTGEHTLQPSLSEDQIRDFERRHKVVLPEEYREFLLRVGNGGPGPGYHGLHPLRVEDDYGGALSRPFPFAQLWCPRCNAQTHDDLRKSTGTADLTQGTLWIGNYGCSVDIHIVVAGDSPGTVWIQDFGSDNGIWPDGEVCPCFFDNDDDFREAQRQQRRYGFYDWYNNWLDHELGMVPSSNL